MLLCGQRGIKLDVKVEADPDCTAEIVDVGTVSSRGVSFITGDAPLHTAARLGDGLMLTVLLDAGESRHFHFPMFISFCPP